MNVMMKEYLNVQLPAVYISIIPQLNLIILYLGNNLLNNIKSDEASNEYLIIYLYTT